MSPALAFSVCLMGGTSLLVQVLVLRELLTSFFGNELSVPVVLLNWMLLVALGSWIAGRIRRRSPGLAAFVGAQLLLSLVIPFVLVLSRAVGGRSMFPGQVPPPSYMLGMSAVTVAPGCLLVGAQFALACRLGQVATGRGAVSHIYALEAFGAVLAGVLFHFLLADYLDAVSLCLYLSVANAFGAFWLISTGPARKRQEPEDVPRGRGNAWLRLLRGIALAVVTAAVVALLVPNLRQTIGRQSLALRWHRFDLVTSINSRFGNLALTRNDSQLSLFRDGNLMFTSGDYEVSEWTAHSGLLQVSSPESVLVIGAGNPLVQREIGRHPISSLTVIDPDPVLVDLTRRWFARPAHTRARNVIIADARARLQDSPRRYDVILVNLPDPSTAALNRYYTVGFFQLAKRLLSDKGVLALNLTGHEAYLRNERRVIHASIYRALQDVFEHVMVIPGYATHILATARAEGLIRSPDQLARRLRERSIQTDFVNEFNLERRLLPFKVDLYLEAIHSSTARRNEDLRPVTYYNFLRLWLRQHLAVGLRALPIIERAPVAAIWLLGICVLSAAAAWYRPLYQRAFRISFVTASIGFVEMSLQLCIILGFQSLAGYLYHQVAILIALNMGGLAFGGWLGGLRWFERRAGAALLFSALSIGAIAYLYGPIVHGLQATLTVVPWCMAALALITGILGGMHFPLAVGLAARGPDEQTAAGSSLYGWDLVGGAAAAALTGLVVIPAAGLTGTAVMVGSLAVAAAFAAAPVCIRQMQG